MEIYSRNQVLGHAQELRTTDSRHFNTQGRITTEKPTSVDTFKGVLLNLIDQVNTTQLYSDEMEEKMAISPEEVNIHEVMIASEKARLTIGFFKTITEKTIKAYNDLMMLR